MIFGFLYIYDLFAVQTTTGTAIFLYTAAPISVAFVAFAIAFFFVRDPIPRGRFKYQYPLKVVGLIGGIIYFFVVVNNLIYNVVDFYPLIALFFVPYIILPSLRRDNLGTLLLSLAGDNTDKALNELVTRRDIDIERMAGNFEQSPEFIRIWLALILTKRNDSVQTNQKLISMLENEYPIERATAAICLLYLNNKETQNKYTKKHINK